MASTPRSDLQSYADPSSQDDMEYLFDAALDAVVGMDADGIVFAWNRRAAKTFGWSRGEAIGALLSDLIVPEKLRDAHRDGLAEYLRSGSGPVLNRRIEISAVNKDGSEFPVELSIIPVDVNSAPVFYGFVRDISLQKDNEERLARARVRDKTLLEIALIAAEPGDFEEMLRRCVALICEMTGWACGHIYLPERPVNPRFMVSTPIWYLKSEKFAPVRDSIAADELSRGEGLPGRIWQSREPVWIPDLSTQEGFLRRADFEDIGLRSGFGFPILHGDNTLAVLEFFAEESREPDEDLLLTMKRIGSHLGRVIERERAQEQARLLTRELAHRVSNLMAVISSVFQRSIRHSTSIDDLQTKFIDRLQALNFVQQQLARSDWHAVNFKALAEGVLAPYSASHDESCVLQGPEVILDSGRALSISLVLHELAVNAAKYGALSTSAGNVKLIWTVDSSGQDGEWLEFHWVETSGPTVAPPTRNGFGSELIQQSIETGLSGTVEVDYSCEGLTAKVRLPL